MRFTTYNIQNGGGKHIDTIITIMKQINPDFITLIEANNFGKHRLAEVSEELGLAHTFLVSSADSAFDIAILSRYPLKHPKSLEPMKRAGAVLAIDSPLGEISIAAVHLDPSLEAVRLAELNAVICEQAAFDRRIIMGDFNALSAHDNYDPLTLANSSEGVVHLDLEFDVLYRAERTGYYDPAVVFGRQSWHTVPHSREGDITYTKLRLDYILISKSLEGCIKDYIVTGNDLAISSSDHFPVTLELSDKHA